MTARFLHVELGRERFARFAAGVPPLPTSLMAYSTTPPYPHDPLRYAELQRYAGCEVLRGRMRAAVGVELFAATSDRSGHDRDDEDGAR